MPDAFLDSRPLDEERDCNALLNVEDILIVAAIRGLFLLLGAAVQIKDVNLIECLHQ